MSADFEFSSPLTLLRGWGRNGWDLTDALVVGYTIDLPFLERYFISTARGLGARITVLSDAHQATYDDVDVRHAGRSYLHAPVLCDGAFHPKLVVLANDQDIAVAIGSGNPTTSGWGHNAELWLVIRAARGSGPKALADLATWLTDLPSAVTMPTWIGQTLAEIALRLVPDDIDENFGELAIIGNLGAPIIDQLPTYPTDELALTAPFFDPGSRAVTRLIERLRPRFVSVAVQPNLSRYDGLSLVGAIEHADGHRVRYLDETGRTSHGKLIEWSAAGHRRAMVGSPNLSVAALLRTTREGANCELAACYTTDATLLPPGNAGTASDLRTRQTFPAQPSPAERDQLILLGALLRPEGIDVELVTRAAAPVVIEFSVDAGPGGWSVAHTIDVIEPGPIACCCPVRDQAGTAVRASIVVDGVVHTSRVVFVTDPYRCQPRSAASAGPRFEQDHNPETFFADTDLAARFRQDFDRLMVAAARAGTVAATNSSRLGTDSADSDDDRWGSWIAKVEDTLRPSLTGILFASAADTVVRMSTRSWSVDIDEGSDIADDEDEEDIDPLSESSISQQRSAPDIDSSAQAVWRKWDRKLRQRIAGANPPLPVEIRLLAVRLHLDLLAAGLWGPDDEEWTDDLINLLRELLPDDDSLPKEVIGTVGALIAIGSALLFNELKQVGGVERDLRAQSFWSAATHAVALADDDAIGRHLLRPGNNYGRNASRSAVERLVLRARSSETDPTAETRALLSAKGIPAEFHDGAWVTHTGDTKNQRTTAATMAATVGKPCAAVVIGDHGNCVVLWAGDDIAYADSTQRRWRLYRAVVGGPSSTLAGVDGLAGARKILPLSRPDHELAGMCATIGISLDLLRIMLTNAG